jgi:hypothetical protein
MSPAMKKKSLLIIELVDAVHEIPCMRFYKTFAINVVILVVEHAESMLLKYEKVGG